MKQALSYNGHVTLSPQEACVYVLLVGEAGPLMPLGEMEGALRALPHWRGDGRNHVLLNLARTADARE